LFLAIFVFQALKRPKFTGYTNFQTGTLIATVTLIELLPQIKGRDFPLETLPNHSLPPLLFLKEEFFLAKNGSLIA
jgi:hypothetical protein